MAVKRINRRSLAETPYYVETREIVVPLVVAKKENRYKKNAVVVVSKKSPRKHEDVSAKKFSAIWRNKDRGIFKKEKVKWENG